MTSIHHPRPGDRPEARVYIVRIWPERHGTELTPDGVEPLYVWRATVLRGIGGQRRSFASLDDCLRHLHDDWTQP